MVRFSGGKKSCVVAWIFGLGAGFCCGPVWAADPMAYWNFEDPAGQLILDASGNSRSGVLGETSATENSDPVRTAGRFGQALNFDGVDDRAFMDLQSVWDSLQAFTVTAWIRPSSYGANGYGRILSKENALFDDFYFFVFARSGQGCLGSALPNAGDPNNPYESWSNAGSISLNQWQHVAVTFDAAVDGRMHLYINGLEPEYQRQDTLGPWVGTGNAVELGNNYSGGAFKGRLDEVKFFSRALTAQEIQREAQCLEWISATTGLFCNTVNNFTGAITLSKIGSDVLQSLQLTNAGSAVGGEDISNLSLWYNAGGGPFDPNLAQRVGSFVYHSDTSSWTITPSLSVGNGDALYLTADVSSLAHVDRTCKLTLPVGGAVFQSSVPLEFRSLANALEQGIRRKIEYLVGFSALAPTNVVLGPTSRNLLLGGISIRNISGKTSEISTLLIRLTDVAGKDQPMNDVFTRLWLESNGQVVSSLSAPFSGGGNYFIFIPAVSLPDQQSAEWDLKCDLQETPKLRGFQIGLPHNQLLNGGTIIVDPESGQNFPMLTNPVHICDSNLGAVFDSFPNPFQAGRENAAIPYYLETAGTVRLDVYDLSGSLVKEILNGSESGGLHQAGWDGRNQAGRWVHSGVYFLRIRVEYAGGRQETANRKIAVLR